MEWKRWLRRFLVAVLWDYQIRILTCDISVILHTRKDVSVFCLQLLLRSVWFSILLSVITPLWDFRQEKQTCVLFPVFNVLNKKKKGLIENFPYVIHTKPVSCRRQPRFFERGNLLPFHYSFHIFVVHVPVGRSCLSWGWLLKCVWNDVLISNVCRWVDLKGVRRQDGGAERMFW